MRTVGGERSIMRSAGIAAAFESDRSVEHARKVERLASALCTLVRIAPVGLQLREFDSPDVGF